MIGRVVQAVVFVGAIASCTGAIDGDVPNTPPADPPADPPGNPPLPAGAWPAPAMRRLTQLQYRNTVRDLFGAGTDTTMSLEADMTVSNGFATTGASDVITSSFGVYQYDQAARALIAPIFADVTKRRALVGCDPAGPIASDACITRFLTGFGRRAWRRPLTTDEVTRYQAGMAARTDLGDSWRLLEMATAALLESPNFLYLVELGEPDPANPARRRLNDYELASRLSYAVTDTMPDVALLDAASRGDLRTDANLKAQVDRLLATRNARMAIGSFLAEWLDVHQEELVKDRKVFPLFNGAIAGAMFGEARQRLPSMVFDRDVDFVAQLLEGRETFINRYLTKLYGIPDEAAPPPPTANFVAYTLPADGPRAGFFMSGAFLATKARPTETSPTLRGIFLRERVLCQVIPPPPPDVDTSFPPSMPGVVETNRQRLERHRTSPSCAACHSLMDPLGFGLEAFDGLGGFRTTEAGKPIDASGDLDGAAFKDARGLMAVLRADKRTAACVTRQLYRYALGRIEDTYEGGRMPDLATDWAASGNRFKDLMSKMVLSDSFRFVMEVK